MHFDKTYDFIDRNRKKTNVSNHSNVDSSALYGWNIQECHYCYSISHEEKWDDDGGGVFNGETDEGDCNNMAYVGQAELGVCSAIGEISGNSEV